MNTAYIVPENFGSGGTTIIALEQYEIVTGKKGNQVIVHEETPYSVKKEVLFDRLAAVTRASNIISKKIKYAKESLARLESSKIYIKVMPSGKIENV